MDKLQLVDGGGEFNAAGVDALSSALGLPSWGVNYQVVAVMGPQSSGKSTLLNAAFGTAFAEMDALAGRSQTTRGVWLGLAAPAEGEPPTLVLDLEGMDGRERGESDTAFERQTALFALAAADALLVNLWAHDVGRESGAGKPLLRSVLAVHRRLFAETGRRTAVVFVLRDRSRTPLPLLEATLRADLAAIWAAIPAPPGGSPPPLESRFHLAFAALPSAESHESQFRVEALALRGALATAAAAARRPPGSAPGPTPPASVPASAFGLSAGQLWSTVKANRDLDLPAHAIMVATVRCAALATEALSRLSGPGWAALVSRAHRGCDDTVASELGGVLTTALGGYDTEAAYLDSGVAASHRAELRAKLVAAIVPLMSAQVTHSVVTIRATHAAAIGAASDEAFNETATAAAAAAVVSLQSVIDGATVAGAESESVTLGDTAAADLNASIDGTTAAARSSRLAGVRTRAESTVALSLGGDVADLLAASPTDLWPKLRAMCTQAATEAAGVATPAWRGLGCTRDDIVTESTSLATAAKRECEARCRAAAAAAAVGAGRDAFTSAFARDATGLPRVWGARDDLTGAATAGKAAAARALARLALLQLEPPNAVTEAAVAAAESAILTLAELTPTTAEGGTPSHGLPAVWAAPPSSVLLPPARVRAAWKALEGDMAYAVANAQSAQAAARATGSGLPPLWAMLLLLMLGWNELMAVLRSPLMLVMAVVCGQFLWLLWRELDVETEMARSGPLPAAIAIAARLRPSVVIALGKMATPLLALAAPPTGPVPSQPEGASPKGAAPGLSGDKRSPVASPARVTAPAEATKTASTAPTDAKAEPTVRRRADRAANSTPPS